MHKDLVVESHQGLQHDTKQSLTLNQSGSEMTAAELAALCVGEINNFRRGEPGSETYSVTLLRRATVQGDEEARAWIEQCFNELVLSWLHSHPEQGTASELHSEEYYVAQTLEYFWRAVL